MGLIWAAIALVAPGLPQLLHLDLFKAILIWALPGLTVATGGLLLAMGPITLGLAILAFLYNLHTAMQY